MIRALKIDISERLEKYQRDRISKWEISWGGGETKGKKIKDCSGILARAVGETLSDDETLAGRRKSRSRLGVGRTGDRG